MWVKAHIIPDTVPNTDRACLERRRREQDLGGGSVIPVLGCSTVMANALRTGPRPAADPPGGHPRPGLHEAVGGGEEEEGNKSGNPTGSQGLPPNMG